MGGTANSFFDRNDSLIADLNNGETFTGKIDISGSLVLTTPDHGMTYEASGTFITQPNQISYKCYGDAGYTDVHVTIGTVVTIIGTKTLPPTNTNFTLNTTTIPGFTNFTAFSLVTALGKHADPVGNNEPLFGELSNMIQSNFLYGKCSKNSTTSANGTKIEFYDDQDHQNLLATFSSTETVAWIEWTTNNKINSDGKQNINIYSISQQNGTFKIAIKYPPSTTSGLKVDPFITTAMYDNLTKDNQNKVNFFSGFNNAIAMSSNGQKLTIDNKSTFTIVLNECINKIYSYAHSAKFNSPRYIYCQFSQTGTILQFYSDQEHTRGIGTFAISNHQKGEYIYKLVLNTDAFMPNNPTMNNIVIFFSANMAKNNSSFVIELVNPNDNAYKTLSLPTNFKSFNNLTFYDVDGNKIVIEKSTTDIFNAATVADGSPDTLSAWVIDYVRKNECTKGNQYESYIYHPFIVIYYESQKITIWNFYNYMTFYIWSGPQPSTTCEISLTEEYRSDTYNSTDSLRNITKITTDTLTVTLPAPITTDQSLSCLYYFCNENPDLSFWAYYIDSYGVKMPFQYDCA